MKNNETLLDNEDSKARAAALDPQQSFLVQAPAGSGKTALLIQRYLALLARVERPGQILAMTFTRKAAGEMRERIIKALEEAAANTEVSEDYDQKTRQLALAALQQNQRLGWQLLEQPAQMNVFTIDSLCSQVIRQSPLIDRWGMVPMIDDAPQQRKEDAIRASLMSDDEAEQNAWQKVLQAKDNSASKVLQHLSDLLSRRDQWLPLFYQHEAQDWRLLLEEAYTEEVEQILINCKDKLQQLIVDHCPNFAVILAYAGENLKAEQPTDSDKGKQGKHLAECATRSHGLPDATLQELPLWQALVGLLLTKECKARSGFKKNEGFPTPAYKEEIKALTAALPQPVVETLDTIRSLPRRAYTDETWALVEAVLFLLKSIAARYSLAAAAAGVMDFIEALLATLNALTLNGNPEEPSDLLLKLDMNIQHILIDEFQDTSRSQEKLLNTLTSGWQSGDGRTLFAVGDPMQSIYRFRQAEVSIFLRAQHQRRIGSVALTPLRLRRNFRSQQKLVEWSNEIFSSVFPTNDDERSGAVHFNTSMPSKPASEDVAAVRAFATAKEEAQYCVETIENCLAQYPDDDIAVLVRNRNHLKALLPALRRAGLAFAALDLDTLDKYPVVRDLTVLTRTLLHPEDDLAWLSLLRAPFCGLKLSDITALARLRQTSSENDSRRAPLPWASLLFLLEQYPDSGLSDSGRQRLLHLLRCWQAAFAKIDQQATTIVLASLWQSLSAIACYPEPASQDAAQSFFEILLKCESNGELSQWLPFEQRLKEEMLTSQSTAQKPRLHILTIYKAKGLQFDTVILPQMTGTTRNDNEGLILWQQRDEDKLLLAPSWPEDKKEETQTFTAYLKKLQKDEKHHELCRVLYVAVTRAKKRLYCSGVFKVTDKGWGKAGSGSMMRLWQDQLQERDLLQPASPDDEDSAGPSSENEIRTAPLTRLPDSFFDAAAAPTPRAEAGHTMQLLDYDPYNFMQRQVGTLVHRILARIGIAGGASLHEWTPAYIAEQKPLWRRQLIGLNVATVWLDEAVQRIERALSSMAQDKEAQWLLANQRGQAQNEWALTIKKGNKPKELRVDRTFVEDGVRWIVDWKVAEPGDPAGTIKDWLASEANQYREQLSNYVELFREMGAEKIKALLYFPLLACSRTVEFDND